MSALGALFVRDALSDLVATFTAFVAVALLGVTRIRARRIVRSVVIVFASIAAASTQNLAVLYVSLEVVALATLASLHGTRAFAWKRAVHGAVASLTMLFGIAWLFGFAHTLDYATLTTRILEGARASGHHPVVVLVAVLFVFAAFAQKLGAFPFAGVTSTSGEGAFVGLVPRLAILASVVRFFCGALGAHAVKVGEIETPWPILLAVVGVASILFGGLRAIAETNVVRVIGATTTAQIGVALLAASTFTPDGERAALGYTIAFVTMTLGALAIATRIARARGDGSIAAFRGLGTRAPLTALAGAFFFVALGGMPPLVGCTATLNVAAALATAGGAYKDGFVVCAAVVVLHVVLTWWAYARVLRAMFFTRVRPSAAIEGNVRSFVFVFVVVAAMLALALESGGFDRALARAATALVRTPE